MLDFYTIIDTGFKFMFFYVDSFMLTLDTTLGFPSFATTGPTGWPIPLILSMLHIHCQIDSFPDGTHNDFDVYPD
jgi:hypothetical protein